MKKLRLRPTLKLYGDSLCTAGASFWIFCARVVILIMATAEAFAWGYVASFFGGSLRWVAAAVAAGFVFAIIWIIDSTFMTLDLKRSQYEHVLLGRPRASVGRERMRFWGGVVGRLLLVTGSLYLSAPFLAQLVFREDIDARIRAVNAERVAAQRLALDSEFDRRREELLERQLELEDARIAEAAGKGLSGRYGRGPAVQTIELQLADTVAELEAVGAERSAALARFDALDAVQVSETYGVELVGNGIQSRGEILKEVLSGPSYQNAELAVRAFLFFLFMGLLILKVFQPRSVEVYYSEQLQSLYGQYRAGAFDELLPPAERSTGPAAMDALRFEDWCLQTYALNRCEERERRAQARELQRAEQFIGHLQRIAETNEAEMAPILEQHSRGRGRVRALEDELDEVRLHLQSKEIRLANQEETRRAMDENLKRVELDGSSFGAAMGVRGRLTEELAQLEAEVLDLQRRVTSLERRREAEVAELGGLDRELSRRRALLDGVEARVRDSRERLVQRFLPLDEGEARARARDRDELKESSVWQARALPDRLGSPGHEGDSTAAEA